MAITVYDQPKTTYSDTTNAVRTISNVINLIDPVDTPFLAAINGLDGASSKFKIRGRGTMIEWLEDSHNPLSDVLAQGTTVTTNTTVFTGTDVSILKVGHQILIDSEYMVVSAVDITNNTFNVYSRSYGGTNATHVSTSTVNIVGMARLEGATADFNGLVDITAPYNYTQIFEQSLKMTGTEMIVDEYGYGDAWVYQANKKLPGMLRLVERALFHGIRSAGSATAPRSFGGLNTFTGTTNTVAAGGAIAKSHVDLLAEKCILSGANVDLFVTNPSIANDLRALLDSSSFVRLNFDNNVFGMDGINAIRTQYGNLKIVESRWCPTSISYMLDSSKIGMYTLRPFGWRPLGRTGDFDSAELVGEFSFALANEAAHGTITGITT